jgi:hypothetical protein
VFLLFVVLTFLGESFAGSGLFMLPLVEEASLVVVRQHLQRDSMIEIVIVMDQRKPKLQMESQINSL